MSPPTTPSRTTLGGRSRCGRARGDFGGGPQEARDKMVDQLVVEGAACGPQSDVEQKGVRDVAACRPCLSIATDPLTYTPFVLGKACRWPRWPR